VRPIQSVLCPVGQTTLHQRYLASTIINPSHHQPRPLDNILEFSWSSLNAIDNAHHGNVPLMTVPGEISIVGREGLRRRRNSPRKPSRSIHDLVADEDPGVARHSFFDSRENLDTVVIRPIVPRHLSSVPGLRTGYRDIQTVETYKIYRSQ
jgi:hypothetical protein